MISDAEDEMKAKANQKNSDEEEDDDQNHHHIHVSPNGQKGVVQNKSEVEELPKVEVVVTKEKVQHSEPIAEQPSFSTSAGGTSVSDVETNTISSFSTLNVGQVLECKDWNDKWIECIV